MAVTKQAMVARSVLAGVAVAAATLVGVQPTGAQDAPTATASPTTVRDGDRITVSGTGCLDEQGSGDGLYVVAIADQLGYPNSQNPDGLSIASTEVAADGTWTLQLWVETREEYFGPYDDWETAVEASCITSLGSPIDELFAYPPIPITYDGTKEASTTTATSPPPVEAPAPTPAPAPAAPVSASASYTG